MCGAYGFSIPDTKNVYDRVEVVNTLADLKPRWNVRPGQLNPVITSHSPNQISRMLWGLIPHWSKTEKHKYSTINAKAETVSQLTTYREPFRRQRCLVPATFFYEPDKVHVEKSPFPWHCFQFKDQRLFAFAGIYDVWRDKNTGKEIASYSMITTKPNAVVGAIHPHMPAILRKEDEATWLNPEIIEPEQLLPLLKPYEPADEMASWPVGDAAKNPRNDFPELIQAIRS